MKIPAPPPNDQELLAELLQRLGRQPGVEPGAQSEAQSGAQSGDPRPAPAEKLAKLLQVGPLVEGKYLHWDQLRHLTPPEGLTCEEWWLGIKIGRRALNRSIPLLDRNRNPFTYSVPDPIQRALHAITQQASGRLITRDQITTPSVRDRYIVSSLIEEAITSSQLEGATTTSVVAKQMLRAGRAPKTRSEQMIVNNYRAMQRVQELRNASLTPERVFELHRIVTEDTLDDPTRAGAFRTEADNIAVNDRMDGKVLHMPPPAHELPERLSQMCSFANAMEDGSKDAPFTDPVIRAILLHFWLAYDQPFVDGNGRTARALFYWAMLRSDYWLAEFISISRILNRAPSADARSFLYTETDENDLVYFLDYHLTVLRRAIDDLFEHLGQKSQQVKQVENLIRGSRTFNHRQLALLSHALRHPGASYTFESHRRSHDVVYQTARTDLLDLTTRGFLHERKVGRFYHFDAPPDLALRLHAYDEDQTR
jgi:Fic family protein